MHVRSYDSDLGNVDHLHNANDTEETEGIVVATLVLPETPEHEKEFHKDHHEGDEPCKQNAIDGFHIPRLRWDLTCNCIRLGGVLPNRCAVITVPAASVYERQLDQEP